MNQAQMVILEIINTNNGIISWYQIDRALSRLKVEERGGLVLGRSVIEVMNEIEKTASISKTAGFNPAQPVYSITIRITATSVEKLSRDKRKNCERYFELSTEVLTRARSILHAI